ncbi:hypothetical protein BT63DRAFT_192942 [Microthyrium microscopicum]|uniref:Velvet domain-containing protein n=1 Tax=Microthyrium microscopicum TaxID=703497 RepID=A0A6A6ULF1_9PEZI|nr:hypothetical protein BT63DRAFT_192942 [Microthyrium microscopicum]
MNAARSEKIGINSLLTGNMSAATMAMPNPEVNGHASRARKEAGTVEVANETYATSSRITRQGRRITYHARVIQQPDRARACGSGAKSCADRRPVDPPPIIELKVFEGGPECEKDITYEYLANFFVFATLENARHIATGRGPGSTSTVPVLTGSPVAGMALLERPTPAGYFIFPDLSVRHEGKYRLNFSLYEELKDNKDMDSETPDNAEVMKSAHVSHRLEVKTAPFTVFSAKKFPGLTTSTTLSQMFAEQGCRVRIRRDVRMRRRDPQTVKGGQYDDVEEDPYFDRRRVSATPDAYSAQPNAGTPHPPPADNMERPRSSSIVSSVHGHARRPSTEQAHPQYQHNGYAHSPQVPQGQYPMAQQWPQHQQMQQPYMPPPQATAYSQPQYQPPPQAMAPQYGYAAPYQQEHHHSRQNSLEYPSSMHSSGPSRANSTPQPQVQQPPMQQPQYYGSQAYGAPTGHTQPPQLSPIHPGPHSMGLQAPPAPSYAPPAIPPQDVRAPSHHQPNGYHSQPGPVNANKRDFASTFDTQPLEQPLRHGARPIASGLDAAYSHSYQIEPQVSSPSEDDITLDSMTYRRADGTARRRPLPHLGQA